MKLTERLRSKIKYQILGKEERERRWIFGIGLAKTGTTSVSEALSIIGYRSLHYAPIARIHNGDAVLEWPWWMNRYDAANDSPVALVYKDLHEKFPNAIFMLTTRNLDAWLNSCYKHFTPEREKADRGVRRFHNSKMIDNCLYGSSVFDENIFRRAWDRHHEDVSSFFEGRGNLHVINVIDGDGWKDICKITGRTEPNVPFPHANSRPGSLRAGVDAPG